MRIVDIEKDIIGGSYLSFRAIGPNDSLTRGKYGDKKDNGYGCKY
jgi:hypothetical protein